MDLQVLLSEASETVRAEEGGGRRIGSLRAEALIAFKHKLRRPCL